MACSLKCFERSVRLEKLYLNASPFLFPNLMRTFSVAGRTCNSKPNVNLVLAQRNVRRFTKVSGIFFFFLLWGPWIPVQNVKAVKLIFEIFQSWHHNLQIRCEIIDSVLKLLECVQSLSHIQSIMVILVEFQYFTHTHRLLILAALTLPCFITMKFESIFFKTISQVEFLISHCLSPFVTNSGLVHNLGVTMWRD